MRDRRILQGLARRPRSRSFPLLYVLVQACSSWSPVDPIQTEEPPNVVQPPAAQPPVSPSPVVRGTLEVSVTGSDALANRGYRVTVQLDGVPLSWTWDFYGSTLRIPNLPRGAYSARLETPDRDCPLEGANPRQFSILAGGESAVEFVVSCPSIDFHAAMGVYQRPSDPSERYVIGEDDAFSLQFDRGSYGVLQYTGTYIAYMGSSGPALLLQFAPDDGRWEAVAIIRGDCLVVEYNLNMMFSDFADGEYCRS